MRDWTFFKEKLENTKNLKIIDQEWVLKTAQDEEIKKVVDHHEKK